MSTYTISVTTKASSKHNNPLNTIESNTVRNEVIRTAKSNNVSKKAIIIIKLICA